MSNLDIIHNELRIKLRSLQNSMIELINDDYADFVNLSSSLAALMKSIENISTEYDSSWSLFLSSTTGVQKAAELVQQKCSDLMSNRSAQILTRNKLSLLLSIEQLSCSLEKQFPVLSTWLPKLISLVLEVELWYRRIPESKIPPKAISRRQSCYSRIKKIIIEELIADMSAGCNNVSNILQLLSLIGKNEIAVKKVADSVVSLQISLTNSAEKDILLSSLYENLLSLRNKWTTSLDKHSQLNSQTELFVDNVLLRYCILFLDENFSSVFVPSDARIFHKCYNITTKFILEWPSSSKCPEVCAVFKTLLGKFYTFVYFKLQTQQLQLKIKAHSTVADFSYNNTKDEQFNCRCLLSTLILSTISLLFKDNEIFLPVLIDKFWDFSLKALSSYADWAKAVNLHFCNSEKSIENAWLNLVVLSWDITNFSNQFSKISTEIIWERLRQFSFLNFNSLDNCVSMFGSEILKIKCEISKSITALLISKTAQELSGVIEIPKQYRWTKKPKPLSYSTYLQATFSICDNFLSESLRVGWVQAEIEDILKQVVQQLLQVFCDQAYQVLESVEQMCFNLKRFKRKQQHNIEKTAVFDADTDEAKICTQLLFDIKFMNERTLQYSIDRNRLFAIEQRLQSQLA